MTEVLTTLTLVPDGGTDIFIVRDSIQGGFRKLAWVDSAKESSTARSLLTKVLILNSLVRGLEPSGFPGEMPCR